MSLTVLCFFSTDSHALHLPSFPTRRSSDLNNHNRHRISCSVHQTMDDSTDGHSGETRGMTPGTVRLLQPEITFARRIDRKSTRLNSSHLGISYAVFCLKKKKRQKRIRRTSK